MTEGRGFARRPAKPDLASAAAAEWTLTAEEVAGVEAILNPAPAAH